MTAQFLFLQSDLIFMSFQFVLLAHFPGAFLLNFLSIHLFRAKAAGKSLGPSIQNMRIYSCSIMKMKFQPTSTIGRDFLWNSSLDHDVTGSENVFLLMNSLVLLFVRLQINKAARKSSHSSKVTDSDTERTKKGTRARQKKWKRREKWFKTLSHVNKDSNASGNCTQSTNWERRKGLTPRWYRDWWKIHASFHLCFTIYCFQDISPKSHAKFISSRWKRHEI